MVVAMMGVPPSMGEALGVATPEGDTAGDMGAGGTAGGTAVAMPRAAMAATATAWPWCP